MLFQNVASRERRGHPTHIAGSLWFPDARTAARSTRQGSSSEVAMKRKKGVPGDDFGGLPDDELDDLEEDEQEADADLYGDDDELDDDDDDEFGEGDEFDDEYEEEEYDEDELDDLDEDEEER